MASRYTEAAKSYEVSIHTIHSWRKKILLILIAGIITISAVLAIRAVFYPPIQQYYQSDSISLTVRTYHRAWENFEIMCFAFVGAILSGIIGARLHATNDLPVEPETQSEHDFEVALETTMEEISENDELISRQKRLASTCFGLFLALDVLLLLM